MVVANILEMVDELSFKISSTGGTTTSASAARRRRITDRGAERLALITGRVQSLSSSPLESDEPILTDEHKDPLSNTETVGKNVASDVRSVIDNSATIIETSAQTYSKPEPLAEQTPLISTSTKSKNPESQTHHHRTFSPKQLRPAITASENIRVVCSITVALLVILADAGFPIVGSDVIKKVLLFRPLLLLLVTNVTIVAAHSLLQEVKHRSTGHAGNADPIGVALEWALLMKTGSSALFMDCSVYSVVVICGMTYN
ncbi:uncharacterized protein LOC143590319 [Bidens hawaiensis]|uniref:uncharacterized protein LOC143590319 n=1 Tax=Bidens hawaiensis TaxID=980011 RepID=UPI00404A9621